MNGWEKKTVATTRKWLTLWYRLLSYRDVTLKLPSLNSPFLFTIWLHWWGHSLPRYWFRTDCMRIKYVTHSVGYVIMTQFNPGIDTTAPNWLKIHRWLLDYRRCHYSLVNFKWNWKMWSSWCTRWAMFFGVFFRCLNVFEIHCIDWQTLFTVEIRSNVTEAMCFWSVCHVEMEKWIICHKNHFD